MPKRTLESLGALIKAKRGEASLREAAKTIGIGSATLMRIQNGHTPDIHTFARICAWLDVDPGEFLGFKHNAQPVAVVNAPIYAHFRASRELPQNTAMALAQMITLAAVKQPQESNTPDA